MKNLRRNLLGAIGLLALSASMGESWAQPATPAAQATSAQPAPRSAVERPPNLKLVNGQWFNGTGFVAATMYTEGGVFRDKEPASVDRTIDLGGQFVVPPFGDAHLHWLAGPGTPAYLSEVVAASLRYGQFYALDLGGIPEFSPRLDPLVNKPDSVDFASAQQRWTAQGGHAPVLYTTLAKRGGIGMHADHLENAAYFLVQSVADIERDWPLFMASKPAIVKLDFVSSEEYDKRADDPAYYGMRGINPKLAAEIVRRAHAAGLRTTAHIQNGPDFHNALAAGVDAIAHMTVGEFTFATDPKTGQPMRKFATNQNRLYAIAEEDVRFAGERRIPVTTTLARLGNLRATNPAEVALVEKEVVLPNLQLMRKYNVPVLIGTDDVPVLDGPNKGRALFDEALYVTSLGVYSPPEVLRMLTETTPQYIFPGRKIGMLRDGYEASFLVYAGNPLDYLKGAAPGFLAPGALTMRFKQGHAINVAAEKAP
ncbi:amidohydrolase family protein [Variovorax sp. dw_954]|uniref:amidohydrolase family protein n=1 Tax=Variovorax sp. dw_954 TaxID=2720078 RepID=UPI001BD28018|nr:amidohydrolase family protein [Variovorax sp. dw_954]